jgi:hypothetical protein
MTAVEVKQEIKNLKRSIELQYGLNRNGDADALAMMNWYKRLTQIESAIENLKKTTEMTAVEWLKEQFKVPNSKSYISKTFEQALEMEKQQIIEAFNAGVNSEDFFCPHFVISESEEYYNETYKKDKL